MFGKRKEIKYSLKHRYIFTCCINLKESLFRIFLVWHRSSFNLILSNLLDLYSDARNNATNGKKSSHVSATRKDTDSEIVWMDARHEQWSLESPLQI